MSPDGLCTSLTIRNRLHKACSASLLSEKTSVCDPVKWEAHFLEHQAGRERIPWAYLLHLPLTRVFCLPNLGEGKKEHGAVSKAHLEASLQQRSFFCSHFLFSFPLLLLITRNVLATARRVLSEFKVLRIKFIGIVTASQCLEIPWQSAFAPEKYWINGVLTAQEPITITRIPWVQTINNSAECSYQKTTTN